MTSEVAFFPKAGSLKTGSELFSNNFKRLKTTKYVYKDLPLHLSAWIEKPSGISFKHQADELHILTFLIGAARRFNKIEQFGAKVFTI